MFKNLLNFDSNADWAAIVTLFFFLIFVGIVVRTLMLKKGHTKRMSDLPLEKEGQDVSQHGE